MITYTDKVTLLPNPNPDINKWTAANANEVKTEVNATITVANAALPKIPGINSQSISYTPVIGDAYKTLQITAAGATNFTIPPNSSVAYDVGTFINVVQYGAGTITFVAGLGVTLRPSSSELTSPGQYSVTTLFQIAANEWMVFNGSSGTVVDWSTGIDPQGWSAFTDKKSAYIDMGKFIWITGIVEGTGSGTTASVKLPVVPNTTIYGTSSKCICICQSVNNVTSAAGVIIFNGGSNVGDVRATVAGGAFTNAVPRTVRFTFMYFK